jgi:hypothetical protein
MRDPHTAIEGSAREAPAQGGAERLERAVARLVAGRWFLPGAGFALLLLTVAATLPPPSSRFTLTVQTRSFTVGSDASGSVLQGRAPDGLPGVPIAAGSRVVLAGILTRLPEAIAPADPQPDDPAGTVTVLGAQGRLSAVRLAGRSRLTVEVLQGDTLAYAGHEGIALTMTLQGQVTTAPTPARVPATLGPPPEPIEVAASPAHPLRALVQLPAMATEPADTGIEDLPIRSLGFSRPRLVRDDRIPFRSDIVAGTLSLSDVGRDVTIRAGDPVLLGCWEAPDLLRWTGVAFLHRQWRGTDCFAGHLARARLEHGRLLVEVVGRAERIAIGPRDGLTELTPSLLAYLLGQENAKLMWSAAAALLVLFWKAHGWARGVLTPSRPSPGG